MAVQTQSRAPTQKVTFGAFAGALTTVLVWILNSFVLPANHQITPELASLLTIIVTFITGYFVPPAMRDQVVEA